MYSLLRQSAHSDMRGNGVCCNVDELFFEGQRSKGQTLHLRRQVQSPRGGIKRSSIRSRGMEFFESRPYVSQDEMRNIDWKVSARKNALYTKIFIEEKDRPIFLVVDLRSHMFFGTRRCFKSVLASYLAAHLAFAGQNGGDRIGAFIFADHGVIECAKGTSIKSLARLLGKIASATQQLKESMVSPDPEYWRAALLRINNRIDSGAAIFLISDFHSLSESARPLLFSIRKRADIFALSVSDPLEERLPSLGMVGMLEGDQVIQFDSSNPGLLQRYKSFFIAQREQSLELFRTLDIPHVAFSTAAPVDDGLRKIFGGRW